MYYIHHFAHQETLTRAASWLARIGFQPHQIQAHMTGVPRLTVEAELAQLDEVRLLINAVERTDPDGFPGFWDVSKPSHAVPEPSKAVVSPDRATPRATVIGWHPPDQASADDPKLSAIREEMGPKWGLP